MAAALAALSVLSSSARASAPQATFYAGRTSAGAPVRFWTTAHGHTVAGYFAPVVLDCGAGNTENSVADIAGPVRVTAGGRWSGGGGYSPVVAVRGRLASGGRASGSIDVDTREDCFARVTWTARRIAVPAVDSSLVGGPVLAGGRAVWVQGSRTGTVVVRRAAGGGAAATVARSTLPRRWGAQRIVALTGASGVLAYERQLLRSPAQRRSFQPGRATQLFAGPAAGPLGLIGRECRSRPAAWQHEVIFTGGDHGCDPSYRWRVRTVTAAGVRRTLFETRETAANSPALTGARLAGRWVTWLDEGMSQGAEPSLVTWDRTQPRADPTQPPVAARTIDGGGVVAFSPMPDGRLVVVRPQFDEPLSDEWRVRAYDPGADVPHWLGNASSPDLSVGARDVVFPVSDPSPALIDVTASAATELQARVDFPASARLRAERVGGFAVDGDRLVYAQRVLTRPTGHGPWRRGPVQVVALDLR